MEGKSNWCFAWHANKNSISGKDRAILEEEAKWNSGDVITISFLDGNPVVQKKVREVALTWIGPGMANLIFDFRENTNTLIRISFQYPGSWSCIGTTCEQITNMALPTMNYGWLDESSSEEEIQSVVLHEFGHALGLIHEHQHPTNKIKWNKEAVIRELSDSPHYWSPEEIEHNIFEPPTSETSFTVQDPYSIMMYAIPASWTTDGFTTRSNTTLSITDKEFIQTQYP